MNTIQQMQFGLYIPLGTSSSHLKRTDSWIAG